MKIVKNKNIISVLKFINIVLSLIIIAVIVYDWINSIPNNSEEKIKLTISLFGITPLFLNWINSKIRALYHKGDIIEKIYKNLNEQEKEKLYNYANEIYKKETH